MNNINKSDNLKEKLKQALTSTARVISDDLNVKENLENNKSSKKFDFFNLENLNSRSDFIKARAESDSSALKKKFSNNKIYKKNLPSNSSCKSLYLIADIYNSKGDYREARDYALLAVDIKENGGAANFHLGVAYKNLGEKSRAKNAFQRAIKDKDWRASAKYELDLLSK